MESDYLQEVSTIKTSLVLALFSILITPPTLGAKRDFKSIANEQPNASYNPFHIRVKVGAGLPELQVAGMDIQRTIHASKNIKKFHGRKRIKFNCQNFARNNRNNDLLKTPYLLASLNSSTGLISFNDHKYHGEIHVVSNPKTEGCDVVNELPLDTYISSLLSREMNSAWPIEALKAQAVAARSYAVHKILSKQVSRGYGHEAYYDLENSEKHQVSGNFFDATAKTAKASLLTKGEVLVATDGKVVPTFFHASCGGHTLRPEQVWENPISGYNNVICDSCSEKSAWDGDIDTERLQKFISWMQKKNFLPKDIVVKNFTFLPSSEKSNNVRLYLNDKPYIVKKSHFRRYFGRKIISSNNFKSTFNKKTKNLTVHGKGLGHGVGMCQVGAKRMADKKVTYKEILAHYFPGLKLVKLY